MSDDYVNRLFSSGALDGKIEALQSQIKALLQLRAMDAAELVGTGVFTRAWRHLLPNLRLVLAALALLILGSCIRAQMLLGFIGLDTQARPSLGAMLYSGTQDALSFHFTTLLVALGLSMLLLLALDSLARRLAPSR